MLDSILKWITKVSVGITITTIVITVPVLIGVALYTLYLGSMFKCIVLLVITLLLLLIHSRIV